MIEYPVDVADSSGLEIEVIFWKLFASVDPVLAMSQRERISSPLLSPKEVWTSASSTDCVR